MVADHDIAGAAFAGAATEMRTHDAKLAPQNCQQRCIGIGIDEDLGAIETKSDTWHYDREP